MVQFIYVGMNIAIVFTCGTQPGQHSSLAFKLTLCIVALVKEENDLQLVFNQDLLLSLDLRAGFETIKHNILLNRLDSCLT